MQITAAVAYAPNEPLVLQDLELEDPRPDEVLVEVMGAGICHTDVKAWQQIRPVPLPAVLGHEGAGVVRRVGSAVKKVRAGDHVVMSFQSCGMCPNCHRGQPAYCEQSDVLNFGAQRRDGTSPISLGKTPIHAPFFGQSSFSTYALASERNTIKVPVDAPIALLGPLGCGIQTGAGAVMNAFRLQPGASIAIFGVGSVGLSAVMAAHLMGGGTIIAIDVQPARLELAQELGATHAINASEDDPIEAIRRIVKGGTDFSLDTSGHPEVFRQAASCIRVAGECGLIGGMAPGQDIAIEANHLLMGRKVRGIIQGDSQPDFFIPRLIQLYLQGCFPFDKIITSYPFENINTAIADMREGRVIKPVVIAQGCPGPQ